MYIASKGDLILLKLNGITTEIFFKSWVSKNGNGTKFYGTDDKIYNLKDSI